MSAPRMEPVRDETGRLRPDLDMRDVPVSVMAVYSGCSVCTINLRAKRGEIPYIKHGAIKYYQPARLFGGAK